ncbi:hypothetical protein [Salipiger mucosus]|uniref:SCP2 domain-containing protein n=1 Tax=Salipiger mucosus DSM 16094 TaxID=1123237 RepID=S9RET1_9RHOB|nr:hypothetical protein [Salipiger mucosus]EPX76610.1 hypothetical protein Salmuc_00442 [Salipiger mucosus DSM 16094]
MLSEIERLPAQVAARPHLLRLGRLFSETVLIRVDDVEHYLVFDRGRIEAVLPGPSKKIPYRFAIATDGEAIAKFWELLPEPGFHDIFGLVKTGRAEILGDILALVKNLRFFKEVLALPRGARVTGESA